MRWLHCLVLLAAFSSLYLCVHGSVGKTKPIGRRVATTSSYDHPTLHSHVSPEECKLRHATMVIRHGARNPSRRDVFAMSKLEDFLKANRAWVDELVDSKPHLVFLKSWTNPFSFDSAGILNAIGMEQQYQIAKRLRNGVLKELVDERGYVPHRHRFSSTSVSRTLKSAQLFSTGFFHDETRKSLLGEHLEITKSPKSDDWPLRFFEVCEAFYKADKSGAFELEYELFHETIFEGDGGIHDAFIERLGPNGDGMEKHLIGAMYRACVFESSLNNSESGFCSLFEANDIDAYEYLNDLSHYWTRSHGNPFGKSLAAPLLKQLLDKYERIAESRPGGEGMDEMEFKSAQEDEALSFMFGHAETIIPLISLMGLYEDSQHWTHSTPRDLWTQRKFRLSEISPFSANVGLLLYDCEGEGPFMRVLHNEKEVVIPGCSAAMCPWREFKKALAHVYDIEVHSTCKS